MFLLLPLAILALPLVLLPALLLPLLPRPPLLPLHTAGFFWCFLRATRAT